MLERTLVIGGPAAVLAPAAAVGVDGATAAHIHKGAASTAGPVVVPLGGNYEEAGCATAPKALIRSIVEHPTRYDVNIHNGKHPAGAARGQLVRASTA